MANGSNIANGKFEGLGFYVDATKRVYDAQSGEHAQGVLAAYVYMRLSLVDLASGAFRTQEVTISELYAPTHASGATHPWQALTAEQKVALLRAIVDRESRRIVPELLER